MQNTYLNKELLLNQNGIVIWFTGLSGAGKSTLAFELEKKFFNQGYLTQVLDGDMIRLGLCNDLGFSNTDRKENIRRIAEVSKLFCTCGIITLSAFISPTQEIREMARKIVGEGKFFEIFVSTPIDVCEKRDTKGLYKQARKGLISEFTGISSVYEKPEHPFIQIDTSNEFIESSVNYLYKRLLPEIKC